MVFDLLIYLSLLGSFCFYIPTRIDGGDIWAFYSLNLITVFSFLVPPKRNVPLRQVVVLVTFAYVTTFLNFRWPIRGQLINLTTGVLALKAIVDRTEISAQAFGKFLLPVCCLELGFLFVQLLGWKDPLYLVMYPQPSATLLLPWVMGCFATLALPYLCSLNLAYVFILLPLLLTSFSWTCLITSAATFIWLIYCKRPQHFATAIWASTVGVTAWLLGSWVGGYGHGIDLARPQAWLRSAQYVKNVWLGNGLGSWAHEGFLMGNGADTYHWRWAHNEFYQQSFEQGIIGLLLALSVLVFLFRRASSPASRGALGSLCALSLAHPIIHWGNLVPFCLIIIIIAIGESNPKVDS